MIVIRVSESLLDGRFTQTVHSPSPGCPVRKHGEEWREVTAAQPAGRSRVASAQFRLALPRMPRAEAQGASLITYHEWINFYPPTQKTKGSARG